jgi:hypothetical protein
MNPEQEKKLVKNDLKSRLLQVNKIVEESLRDIASVYFENRPVNMQAVPDIARDKVKHLFEQNEQYKINYELEPLTRNGIALICKGNFYKRYVVKILYSPDGKLPVEGMSGRKKRLLCQKDQPSLWPPNIIYPTHSPENDDRDTLTLAIVWRARFEGVGADKIAHQDLLLVRTIEGKNGRPVIYWTDPIDPMSMISEEDKPIYSDDMDDDFGISLGS